MLFFRSFVTFLGSFVIFFSFLSSSLLSSTSIIFLCNILFHSSMNCVCVCAFFSSSFDSLNLIVFFGSFSLSFVSILNVSVFFSIPFNYKYHWRVLIRIVVYCTIFLLCKQKKNARAGARSLPSKRRKFNGKVHGNRSPLCYFDWPETL